MRDNLTVILREINEMVSRHDFLALDTRLANLDVSKLSLTEVLAWARYSAPVSSELPHWDDLVERARARAKELHENHERIFYGL